MALLILGHMHVFFYFLFFIFTDVYSKKKNRAKFWILIMDKLQIQRTRVDWLKYPIKGQLIIKFPQKNYQLLIIRI